MKRNIAAVAGILLAFVVGAIAMAVLQQRYQLKAATGVGMIALSDANGALSNGDKERALFLAGVAVGHSDAPFVLVGAAEILFPHDSGHARTLLDQARIKASTEDLRLIEAIESRFARSPVAPPK